MTGPTAAKAPKALPEETGQQFEWLHQAVRRFAEELDEALSSLSPTLQAGPPCSNPPPPVQAFVHCRVPRNLPMFWLHRLAGDL